MRIHPWHAWLVGLLLTGCHWVSGVRLENIATASGKPSNVAALVSVTNQGAPVRELDDAAFRVFENDQLIDPEKGDVRLLDPVTVAAFQTVLVIDLGHGATEEGKRQLAKAAAGFIRKVRQRQPVTVFVFDGSPRVRLLGDFSVEPGGTGPEQLDNLLAMVPADLSRNLRGAVMAGLDELDSRLAKSSRPVQVGTLVVFSRGPDVAGRIAEEQYEQRVKESTHQLVYIDVEGDVTDGGTQQLADQHHIASQAADTLPIAFEEAAQIASHLTEQYYLISYCSPARAGLRQLKVEVTVAGIENEAQTDRFEATFDATGFSPGCNSASPPRFVTPQRAGATGKPSASTNSGKSEDREPSDETELDDETEVPPPNKPGYAP